MHGLIRLVVVAELLATELVSNAVRHIKGPAALRLRWAAGVLRIGAWDADPAPPEPPVPLERVGEEEEGRGLALVRACSDLWGWRPLAREGNPRQDRLVRTGRRLTRARNGSVSSAAGPPTCGHGSSAR